MSERDALPQGDPRRAQYDKTIAGYKAGHGTDVTVNTGPMAPSKTAGTKVDEDMLGLTKSVMALDQISASTSRNTSASQDKAGSRRSR
jgi:hypothetical protein